MYGETGAGGTTAGEGYKIDFDGVETVATRSDDIGNELVKLAQFTSDSSAAVKENHPGWALAGAMNYAQGTNEFNIQGFGRWSCDMSDRLKAAMQAYKDQDHDVSDELNGIGS